MCSYSQAKTDPPVYQPDISRISKIGLLEQPAHGPAGSPAGDAAGGSFGHFLWTATGDGLDVAQQPGDPVEQAPGLVYAHGIPPFTGNCLTPN